MDNPFSELPPASAAASFLAVARRQINIEAKLAKTDSTSQSGMRKRANLEKQQIEGEIKPRVLTKKQRREAMLALIHDEIGDLLEVLKKLPAYNGQKFHTTLRDERSYSDDVRITCRYGSNPKSSLNSGYIIPAFVIEISPASQERLTEKLSWTVIDYTRKVRSRDYYYRTESPRSRFHHTAELRSQIAKMIARMASNRVHEIAVAMSANAQKTVIEKPGIEKPGSGTPVRLRLAR